MDRGKRLWLGAGILAAAGLFIYWPALHGAWLWDDDGEILHNRELTEAGGWWRIWLEPGGRDYFPLKTSLQWLEWRLWGPGVEGYHLVSLAFHVLAAFLLWRILARRAGEAAGFLAGLLFAVHPLAVESVAWISELKNVMSLPLLLLAAGAYRDGEERRRLRPASPFRCPSYYRALAWFVAAMLCKSSVAMFPVILLLYAWWLRGRVAGADWAASLPFFGASLLLGAVTIYFQAHRAIAGENLHLGGWLWRLAGAGRALVFYLGKGFLPLNLMPVYPDWSQDAHWLLPAACGTAVLAALVGMTRGPARRGVLFGLGFFAVNLLPVLGFVPMYYLRISPVADHLCYLPLAGLAGLAAAAAGRAWRAALLALACVVFAVLARRQAAIYRDPLAFWTAAAERNPGSWTAQNNLGNVLVSEGKWAEAEPRFGATLRLRPDYAEAENNLGAARMQAGRPDEAAAHFERAVRLRSNYAEAYYNWASALVRLGRYPEAVGRYGQALQLDPDYAEAYGNRGLVLIVEGRSSEAVADFEHALRLQPDSAASHRGLGLALERLGRWPEAIEQFRQTVRIDPGRPQPHDDLGEALLGAGMPGDAAAEFSSALQLDPSDAEAQNGLAEARRRLGRAGP